MGQDAWYSVQAMLPPLRVKVRSLWAGRIFETVRTVHPKKKRVVWATYKDGEVEYLPPKGRSRIWGDAPTLWQPVDPSLWQHALPEPVALSAPEWPPKPIPVETADWTRGDGLWWRDATQLSYSLLGEISRTEAEGRVMRALNTNWRVQVESPRDQTNAELIARLGQERWLPTAESEEPLRHDWRPPFEPLGADLDDFLRAMAWFAALNPKELWHKRRKHGDYNRAQAVLVYRAMDPPSSWGFIGTKWGVSGERVRQVYQSSLDKIVRAANGQPVFKHVAVRDPLLEVRAANKRHASSQR